MFHLRVLCTVYIFKSQEEVKNLIKSILFSLAYGDSFGMPTEMMTSKEIKARIGYVDQFLPSQKSIYFSRELPAGSVTDDTIFSLILVDMIIENSGEIDTKTYIEKISAWIDFNSKKTEVVGPSTMKAIAALKKGVPIEKVGIFGTTNGAAMKIVPIGISNIFNSEEKLINDVYKVCLPTHNTKVAIGGAVLIAHLIRKFCRKETDWSSIWDESYRVLEKTDNLGVDTSHALITSRVKHVYEIVNREISIEMKLEQLKSEIGTSMEMIETVPTAIGLAYLSKGNLKKCARFSANIGGDTDTIGAISCALVGAHKTSILDRELKIIEEVNGINFDDISNRFMKTILRKTDI